MREAIKGVIRGHQESSEVITSVRSEGSTATKRCNALAAACSRSMCALDTPAAVLPLLLPPPPPPPRSTGTARSTVGVPAASPSRLLLLLLLLLTVSSVDVASAPTSSKPSAALGTAPSSLVEPLDAALVLGGARLVRRASRHITAINPRLIGIHSIAGAAPSSATSRALGVPLAAPLLLLLLPLARCCSRAAASAAARARAPWGKPSAVPSGDERLGRRGVEGEAEGVARSSAPDEGGHQRSSEAIRGHQMSSVAIRGHQRPSEAIRGHQRPSDVIRGHQRPSEVIRGHQMSSEAIRGHLRSSEVIRGHPRSSGELEQRTGLGQLLRRLWRRLVLDRVERLAGGEREEG